MQFCDSKCGHCARNFWEWLKTREAQMRMPLVLETKDGSVESGTSFASAAASSVGARVFSGNSTSHTAPSCPTAR